MTLRLGSQLMSQTLLSMQYLLHRLNSWPDNLVAEVFLNGEQAFISEFPRHTFRRFENVARRIQQRLALCGTHRMQVMNHQRHRLALLSNAWALCGMIYWVIRPPMAGPKKTMVRKVRPRMADRAWMARRRCCWWAVMAYTTGCRSSSDHHQSSGGRICSRKRITLAQAVHLALIQVALQHRAEPVERHDLRLAVAALPLDVDAAHQSLRRCSSQSLPRRSR